MTRVNKQNFSTDHVLKKIYVKFVSENDLYDIDTLDRLLITVSKRQIPTADTFC